MQIWLYFKFIKMVILQRIRFIPLLFALASLSCDSEPGLPTQSPSDYRLSQLTIQPNPIVFTPEQSVKDTTVQVRFQVRVMDGVGGGPSPSVLVFDPFNDIAIAEAVMTPVSGSSDLYEHVMSILTTTTSIRFFNVSVYMVDENVPISNSITGQITITGFSTGRPILLFEQTPATVSIPVSGTQSFDLKAKVAHPNGSSMIDRVEVAIRGQNGGALSGSPFQLFDDGNLNTNGDVTPGDSLYTRRFNITSGNNPETYTLKYVAIDRFGAASDTLTATMRFQ